MIQKICAVLVAVSMFAVAGTLSGCGSSASNSASLEQSLIAKAAVTIAAKFPTAGEAVKSLIPSGAQAIVVYAQAWPYTYDPNNPNPNGTLIATLTPAQPSATVQLAPGMYMINAAAFDSADISTGKMIGQTSTGGEVKSGQANTIVLTFMDGQWTLVNTSDVATPLVLSDNVTQLNDFVVNADMQSQMGKAVKSAIDYTKPVGGGSGTVRLRFNNNTSARTYGGMASQFVGTVNSSILGSDSYNLTKKCRFDYYYGLPCDETAGDQIVMISGKEGSGDHQSGGYSEGNILYGSAYALLPGGGQTVFTQNGTTVDLMSAIPDTVVTSGNIISGGIIEWKPSTNRTTTLGTPAVAKMAKSARAMAVKAQSTNTTYANLSVKDFETIVCSGASPQNRGTWSFANNTSAGKVVLGSRVCYSTNNNNIYLSSQYNPATMMQYTDAGDYSFGLVPAATDYGDYCHVWDYEQYIYSPTGGPVSNPNYNTCKQQLPGASDVYTPWNFKAVKTATKTTINYGSFKFNFWGESTQSGAAYIYPFRAKGSTTITPAR